jgi:hypothetical protein
MTMGLSNNSVEPTPPASAKSMLALPAMLA